MKPRQGDARLPITARKSGKTEDAVETYSLPQAAKIAGVARRTLKKWLSLERLKLPKVACGSKLMIRRSDLERLADKRSPRRDPGLELRLSLDACRRRGFKKFMETLPKPRQSTTKKAAPIPRGRRDDRDSEA